MLKQSATFRTSCIVIWRLCPRAALSMHAIDLRYTRLNTDCISKTPRVAILHGLAFACTRIWRAQFSSARSPSNPSSKPRPNRTRNMPISQQMRSTNSHRIESWRWGSQMCKYGGFQDFMHEQTSSQAFSWQMTKPHYQNPLGRFGNYNTNTIENTTRFPDERKVKIRGALHDWGWR